MVKRSATAAGPSAGASRFVRGASRNPPRRVRDVQSRRVGLGPAAGFNRQARAQVLRSYHSKFPWRNAHVKRFKELRSVPTGRQWVKALTTSWRHQKNHRRALRFLGSYDQRPAKKINSACQRLDRR